MTNIRDLPKDPHDAFQQVLENLLSIARATPKNNAINAIQKTACIADVRILQTTSRRLMNSGDYSEPLENVLQCLNGSNYNSLVNLLSIVEKLFLANSLDDHFIDADDDEHFNGVDWVEEDRRSVLGNLQEARQMVSFGASFEDDHKRRVLYWITKAESEVLKPKGRFATILASVSEIGDAAKKLGKDGEPLAALVQKVRTKTVRNVVEHRQLEAPSKPKQLEAPKPSEDQ
ncbi:hypothetical protein [Mameliella alba]|uniref:DNA topoisomerase IV subunit B n=1 Tax=Mameliella alba TaxID=561184 RepID=A0A0B3RWH3_9RHOB|nr:hypothetical protein [Mameliella alba]KHQ51093.1 DNA topoisomerase IV subunit B [Mameliella alba]